MDEHSDDGIKGGTFTNNRGCTLWLGLGVEPLESNVICTRASLCIVRDSNSRDHDEKSARIYST